MNLTTIQIKAVIITLSFICLEETEYNSFPDRLRSQRWPLATVAILSLSVTIDVWQVENPWRLKHEVCGDIPMAGAVKAYCINNLHTSAQCWSHLWRFLYLWPRAACIKHTRSLSASNAGQTHPWQPRAKLTLEVINAKTNTSHRMSLSRHILLTLGWQKTQDKWGRCPNILLGNNLAILVSY